MLGIVSDEDQSTSTPTPTDVMSTTKRRWQGGGDDDGDRKRSRSRSVRRKHLYLLLDDWSRGFTIHRIDADSFHSDSGDRQDASLPGSPALRIESPAGTVPHAGSCFAAMGSTIFVFANQRCALVYDTMTDGLSVGPHAPAQMQCDSGVTVPVGGTLYALSHRFSDKQQSLEALSSWDPNPNGGRVRDEHGLLQRRPRTEGGGWAWKSLPAPPPATFTHNQFVTSYAVHPDGRTIFMTTAYRETPGLHVGTFSFDTGSCAWRWHGEWAPPFVGQGHFDAGLDRWVGLRRDGHVCACRVASRTRTLTRIMQPEWQTAAEKLFRRDAAEDHLSASLTYIGGGSRFCLVESVVREGVDDMERSLDDQDGGYWLHVTMFGLRHNQKRELQTTHHQSRRSYVVSRHEYSFAPEAFWM